MGNETGPAAGFLLRQLLDGSRPFLSRRGIYDLLGAVPREPDSLVHPLRVPSYSFQYREDRPEPETGKVASVERIARTAWGAEAPDPYAEPAAPRRVMPGIPGAGSVSTGSSRRADYFPASASAMPEVVKRPLPAYPSPFSPTAGESRLDPGPMRPAAAAPASGEIGGGARQAQSRTLPEAPSSATEARRPVPDASISAFAIPGKTQAPVRFPFPEMPARSLPIESGPALAPTGPEKAAPEAPTPSLSKASAGSVDFPVLSPTPAGKEGSRGTRPALPYGTHAAAAASLPSRAARPESTTPAFPRLRPAAPPQAADPVSHLPNPGRSAAPAGEAEETVRPAPAGMGPRHSVVVLSAPPAPARAGAAFWERSYLSRLRIRGAR